MLISSTQIPNKSKVSLENGIVRLNLTLNDYPKATIVQYVPSGTGFPAAGNLRAIGPFEMECENVSIKTLPPIQGKSICVDEVTYEYIHSGRRLMETSFNVKKLVDAVKGTASQKDNDYYYVMFSSVQGWVRDEYGIKCACTIPDFKVKLPRNPSTDESMTLREVADPVMELRQEIYKYNFDSVSNTSLGAGSYPSNPASDVTIAKGASDFYKNTILTWSKSTPKELKAIQNIKLIRLKNDDYILYEGDFNPHIAPPADDIPKDLSPVIDIGGITKEFKITLYEFGQPSREISGSFGYAHAALELIDDPEKPNTETEAFLSAINGDASGSGNALQEIATSLISSRLGYPSLNASDTMIWRLISIKDKQYKYEKLDINVSTYARTKDGSVINFEIPDNLRPILNPNIEVLAEEITTGWELRRFQPEDPQKWTQGSVSAWLKLKAAIEAGAEISGEDKAIYNYLIYKAKCNLEQYLWRKVPIWERVVYSIEPYAEYYKDSQSVEWNIEYVQKNQLPQYANTNDTSEIAILYPDPDWVPGLFISARNRYSSSIGAMGNPNFNPFQKSYYEINPTTIFTGNETIEYTQYCIMPSDNTLSTVSSMYNRFVDLNGLADAVAEGSGLEGTVYKKHSWMTVNDYGLKTTPLTSVSTVSGSFPSESRSKLDRYTQYTSIKTVSDNSFKSQLINSNFSINEGRPPEAVTRKPFYKTEIGDSPDIYKNTITYISSTTPEIPGQRIDVVNVAQADTREEAVKAASFRLELAGISNSSGSYRGPLKDCNFKDIIGATALRNSKYIIKGVSYEIHFSDGQSFAQAPTITFGIREKLAASANTKPVLNSDTNTNTSAGAEVKPKVNVLGYTSPSLLTPSGYSRWGTLS